MKNILLNEKPILLLQSITKQNGKKGINEIGKNCYATYRSRYNIVLELESLEYIQLERAGREVICTITDKGREALKHIDFFI